MNTFDALKISSKILNKNKVFFISNSIAITVAICLLTIMLSVGFGIKNYVTMQFEKESSILSIEVRNQDSTSRLNPHLIEKIKKIDNVTEVFPQYLGIFAKMEIDYQPMNYNELGYPKEDILVSLASIFNDKDLKRKKLSFKTNESMRLNQSNWIIIPKSIIPNHYKNYPKSVVIKVSRSKNSIPETNFYPLNILGIASETLFDRCYIPFKLIHEIHQWQQWKDHVLSDEYPMAMVYANSVDHIDHIQEKIQKMGFKTSSIFDVVKTFEEINLIIISILGMIGLISLITGAIGVFNTSYASVIRRTKEIGIYKAIGASRSDILWIFLWESIFTAICGGLFGCLLSYLFVQGLNYFLSSIENFPMLVFKWWFLISALLISVVSCVLATSSPAWKASKFKPVESLRYE